MATVGLALAGSAIGGSGTIVGSLTAGALLGFAGAAIGGIIDQRFLFPALFGTASLPNSVIEGPRLNEAVVTSAAEGSPITYGLGPECPTGGVLIWQGPREEVVIEEKNEQSVGGGKGGGGGGGGSSETVSRRYEYYRSFCVLVSDQRDRPARRVLRVWADERVIYNNGFVDAEMVDGIDVYLGDHTSPPSEMLDDSDTVAASGGAANVPSYNGSCVVQFRRFFLTATGNRLPQIRVLFEADASITRADAFRRLCERAGVASNLIDVSRVSGCLRGMVISGVASTSASLETLMAYTDSLASLESGVVTFFDRGTERQVVVPTRDLGATVGLGPGSGGRGISITASDTQLSRSVEVEFIDPAKDWLPGRERELSRVVQNEDVNTLNLQIVMNGGEARAIAARALHRPRIEGGGASLSLPPAYAYVNAGDIVSTVSPTGRPVAVRADRVRVGASGRVEVAGVRFDPLVAEVAYPADDVATATPALFRASPVRGYVAQLPAMSVDDSRQPTVYGLAALVDRSGQFRGAKFLRSPDGETFFSGGSLNAACIDGFTAEAVPYVRASLASGGFPTPTGVFCARPIRVRLFGPDDALASSTRQQVMALDNNVAVYLQGGRAYLVGYVSAVKATSVTDANVWVLRELLWGVLGSAPPPLVIEAGGRWVFPPSITRRAVARNVEPVAAIGDSRTYRLVPVGAAVESVDDIALELSGASVRPRVYRVRWERIGPVSPADNQGSGGVGGVRLRWDVRAAYPMGSIFGPVSGLSRMRFALRFFDGPVAITEAEVIGRLDYSFSYFDGPWLDFVGTNFDVTDPFGTGEFSVEITPYLDDVPGDPVTFNVRNSREAGARAGGVY